MQIRRKLGVGPGSVLEWSEEGDTIVVRRAGQFSSEDLHKAVFGDAGPNPHTIEELKEGIRCCGNGRRSGSQTA